MGVNDSLFVFVVFIHDE